MVVLNIPTPFRPYTDGAKQIEIQVQTVQEAIETLVVKYPSLGKHLFTEEGTLRNFVILFLNGEDIRYLQGLETPLQQGDELQIIPSIAGGISFP